MNQEEEYGKLSFEEAVKELESVVSRLDAGDVTLDESIALFQKGILLSKLCSFRLDEIEKKVRILTDDKNGSKAEIPFGDDMIKEEEKE